MPQQEGQTDDLCYFVMHNGHTYGFHDLQFAAQRQRQSLSWYKAMIRAATGNCDPEEKGAGKHNRSELGVAAYNLFRETQEMQPDMDTIISHIEEKYGAKELCGRTALYRPTRCDMKWEIKELLPLRTSCRLGKKGERSAP